MRSIFILTICILSTLTARSQDFNYTVSADSVSWQELNSQTFINPADSSWKPAYRMAIGFSFEYLGRSFDSLSIETNGYLVFDNDRNYAFAAFTGFCDRIDSSGNHALIGYELSGTAGNRILKIQFKNAGSMPNETRAQSWQIWLRENGDLVELRCGNSDYAGDSTQNCRTGLLNQNMDTANRGLFLGGSYSSPQSQPVNDTHPDTESLDTVPPQGWRYVFTPGSN